MSRSHRPLQDENVAAHPRIGSRVDRPITNPTVKEDRESSHTSHSGRRSPATAPNLSKDADARRQTLPMQAGAADGYKDETDQRASQLRLSDIGVDFVQNIKMKDIEACARFVKSNPVLLDEAEADQKYSTLAMKAFKQGAQAQGRNCIVKGRMVIHCSKLSRGDITKFFRSLEKRESSMAKRFYNECEGKERELSYLVQSQARELVSKSGDSLELSSATLQRLKSQTTTGNEGSDASTIKALPLTPISTLVSQNASAIDSRNDQSASLPGVLDHRLSPLAARFIEIPESRFEDCYTFLKENSSKLDFSEDHLQKEAKRALLTGQRRYGKKCIQRSLLLRRWERIPNRKNYFRQLQLEDSVELIDLLRSLDKSFRALEDEISLLSSEESGRNTSPRPNLASRQRSTASQPGDTQKGATRIAESQGTLADYQHKRPDKPSGDRGTPAMSLPTSLRPASRHASSLPDSTRLESRFQVRRASFYTLGRVFAMLWHEAAQRLDDDSTSSVRSAPLQSSRSVDTVYKYNRRLVIVKAGHGFCWCVPISTYGTHGLRRAGLTTEDIEAHAIIFVESDRPRPLVGEPAISKRPIAVVPASEDQRLDPASRINFAKVYTVEHNAKVMDIGRVSDRSMPRFKQYFQEQLKLE